MRKKNTTLNILITSISRIIFLLIGFFTRKAIIQLIAVEYLGLNSLYANVLDLLNLAELGLGVAIQVRMYEPLVNNDYAKVAYLLSFARKIYMYIGLIVLVVGIGASFLLQYVIKDSPFNIWYVRGAFLISVIGISLSYFCADKRLFFEANERYFYITVCETIVKVIVTVIALVLLYFTKEYLFYSGVIALSSFTTNLFLYIIFKRKYAIYCSSYNKELYVNEIVEIKKNLKDVVPMKLGVFVFTSTDSVIISTFIGLTFVAIYSNYNLLFVSLLSISSIVSTALVSTFGKMEKENSNRDNLFNKYRVYTNLQFMFSSFTTVCMLLLVDKFIYLWVGDGLYIGAVCVVLFCLNYFIHSLFQPLSTLYTSTGKFRQDKVCMIISAIMNIVISVVLVIFIGLPGVIIGTLCANLFTYITRTIVIEKGYFNRSSFEIMIRPIIQLIILVIETVICFYAIKNISLANKWIEFILCGIICLVLTNVPNVIMCKGLGYFKLIKRLRGTKHE